MTKTWTNRRPRSPRNSRGAIYTACFASFVIPIVITVAGTVLQAALSFYDQDRLRYIGTDVIENFDSLSDLQSGKFNSLFSALAAANNLPVQGVKSEFSPCTASQEETVEIKVTGRVACAPGLFLLNRPFVQTFKIKCSQFDTYGYLAINSYPYCEFDPTQGLSTYLPLFRPSPASPTWQFTQDTAIGGVRKAVSQDNTCADQKPSNWKQLAENLVSIY